MPRGGLSQDPLKRAKQLAALSSGRDKKLELQKAGEDPQRQRRREHAADRRRPRTVQGSYEPPAPEPEPAPTPEPEPPAPTPPPTPPTPDERDATDGTATQEERPRRDWLGALGAVVGAD